MDKPAYLRQRLLRNPSFLSDLLQFHRSFPRLFELWDRESEHPPIERFPDWARPLLEMRSPRALALIPRTIQDLPHILQPLAYLYPSFPFGYRSLIPEWDDRYFEVLGESDRAAFQQAEDALLSKWPSIPYDALRWGRLDQLPRSDLIAKPELYTPGMWREWLAELTRLASDRSVLAFIPVYADTTQEDLSAQLNLVRAEQRRYPRRRARPDQYEKRLLVWDTYQQRGNFEAVARELKQRPSTIKRMYVQAWRDIVGPSSPLPRTSRQRLLKVVDPAVHTQQCPICQAAKVAEDMCPAVQAFVNQDTRSRSRRELPLSAKHDRRSGDAIEAGDQ